MNFIRSITTLCLFAMVMLLLSSCAKVSRERTLPPSINSVYVPMVVNRTAEPGIEEDITVYIQEEFLADGRLELDSRRDSDAYILITLDEFETEATSFDSDDYQRRTRQRLRAKVQILQNKPNKPAFGPVRTVESTSSYNNDKRTISYTPEQWGRDELLREFARDVVEEVITGRFEDL